MESRLFPLASFIMMLVSVFPVMSRDTDKTTFLNTLFNGKEYPVALSMSPAYPWVVDYDAVKTSCRQDDAFSDCWFSLDIYVPEDSATVSFNYQVRYHKEEFGWAKYANLACSIDDVEVFSNNGTDQMETAVIKVPKGYHVLKWNLHLGEAWENWDYFASIENMKIEGISDNSALPEFSSFEIPFYNVQSSRSEKRTIVIDNRGRQPLEISDISGLKSPFKVNKGYDMTVMPGQSEYIEIEFAPENDGYYEADMLVSTNVGDRKFYVDGISTQGLVVVSPVPGGLSGILKNTNCESVSIMGHLNRADQNHFYKLQKCKYLNLAGTDIEIVTNGGLNNLWHLKTLVLPSSLKILDTTWTDLGTFEGDELITLFDLSCIQLLSSTPPKVYQFYSAGGNSEEKPLGNLRPSTRLLVPKEHKDIYASNEIWNKLTIIPVTDDRAKLNVSIETDDPRMYYGMSLNLENRNTFEINSITLQNRNNYTFVGVVPYHRYNISLTDKKNRVLGGVNDFEVGFPNDNLEITNIQGVHSAVCKVFDDRGKDVTSDIIFEWTDDKNNILSNDNKLSSVLSRDSVICNMSLPENLGRIYREPMPQSFRLIDSDSTIICHLLPIEQIQVQGTVDDAVSRKPLKDVPVLISQYINRKYQYLTKVVTDDRGRFFAPLKNDSTVVSVSIPDYDNYELSVGNLNDDKVLSEVHLQPEAGVPVEIRFSYQMSTREGETAELHDYYHDYNNVVFMVRNISTGCKIDKMDYQWPSLTLLENSAIGDSISFIVNSKTDSFMPVEAFCRIDSLGVGAVSFPIVEFGGINSSYTVSENASTVGMLFGSDKKLIDFQPYYNSKVEFSSLKDGKYYLVTMGGNSLFNSFPSLSALSDCRLVEDEDYLISEIDVISGEIKALTMDSVPLFDENAHKFTGHGTAFKVNKSSVVAGSYVTIDAMVDFNADFKGMIADPELLIQLPAGVEFVTNSLLIGGSSSTNYILKGDVLAIPIGRSGDNIRFCLQPVRYGDYIVCGNVRFGMDGQSNKLMQPIGSSSFTASNITIDIPHVTPTKEITVVGSTLPDADIVIFDNNVLVGKTKASGSGSWQARIELDNAYNMSYHQIFAKIIGDSGVEMVSETKTTIYNKDEIAVNKVTMYHDNPEVGKTFEVVFDFINPAPVTSSYTYYIYNKNFTFTIDLTDNNPERVKGVVLWVKTGKGREVALDAKYDQNRNLWIAAGQFGNMYDGDIPVNVSVSLDRIPVCKIDEDAHQAAWDKYVDAVNSLKEIDDCFDEIEIQIEAENNSDNPDYERVAQMFTSAVEKYIGEIEVSDQVISEEEFWDTVRYFDEHFDEDFDGFLPINESIYGSWTNHYDNFIIQTDLCRINDFHNDLTAFEKMEVATSGGNTISVYNNDNTQIIIDPIRDFVMTTTITTNDRPSVLRVTKDKQFDKNIVLDLGDNIVANSKMALSEKWVEMYVEQYRKRSLELYKRSNWLLQNGISGCGMASHQSAQKLRKYAKCLKPFLNRLFITTEGLCRYLAARKEVNNILKTIDRLPDFYECAKKKYPQETAEVYEDIVKLTKSLKGNLGKKVFVPVTAGSVGSTLTAVVHGAFAGTFTEQLSANEWRILDSCIDRITALNSTCVKEERQRLTDEGRFLSNCKDAPNQIDPSGYVYETVPSNRLEGVKATCYQKVKEENIYGDIIERAVVWNAANFEQKNPLYTDDQGMYRWDVPEGLWMVKFEKDGYETACTDWLPVPPPQLDINIAMIQYSQPEVVSAEWTTEGIIEVRFDKYMLPSSLNNRTITLCHNGENVLDDIIYYNEESSFESSADKYVSCLRLGLSRNFAVDDILDLVIDGNVRSYAGIALGSDVRFRLSQVPTVTEIQADSKIVLRQNEYMSFHVSVRSLEAAAGKNLSISNSSPIVVLSEDFVKLDENGEADVYIHGLIPGSSTLKLSVDGYDQTKQITVVVTSVDDKCVAVPYASVDDKTTLTEPIDVYLSCETEGAVIYYTLDGSCPCDYASSILYDGKPITIDKDTELRIIACKPGYTDSEIAVYNYSFLQTSTDGLSIKDPHILSPEVTHDYVYLNLNGRRASQVAVWTSGGSLIQTKTNVPDGSRINLGALPDGIYLVSIIIGGETINEKIIKK